MIDLDGYRPNVGIILSNREGQVLWAKRIGQDAWQFPQGGIQENEDPETAMFRELHEEIGLLPEHVSIIDSTRNWLRYRLPPHLVRHDTDPVCIGQKQRWFLLRMECGEDKLCLNACDHPEFDSWRWVDYWHPAEAVVFFKREVYQRALRELSTKLFPDGAPPIPPSLALRW